MEHVGRPFEHVQDSEFPWIRCPSCRAPLTGARPKFLRKSYIAVEREIFANEVDPVDDEGWFSAWAVCDSCKERLSAAGNWSTTLDQGDDGRAVYQRLFYPKWFSNPPCLLRPPARAPARVKEEIARADRLFWADLFACAAALRRVVEFFLDSRRVPRRKPKRRFLSLAERIRLFVQKVPATRAGDFRRFLHAVRVTGNEGVHSRGTSTEDVQLMVEWIRRVLIVQYPERDRVKAEARKRARQ
jgi:hypothetical protein